MSEDRGEAQRVEDDQNEDVTIVQKYKSLGPSERELLAKPDLEDMSLEELQIEYRTLDQFELNAAEHEEYWERYHQIWREIKERTEVQEPPCPECGGRSWSQSPGEPLYCGKCGKEGVYDDDLREAIHTAWDRMLGMGEVSADV